MSLFIFFFVGYGGKGIFRKGIVVIKECCRKEEIEISKMVRVGYFVSYIW